MGSPSNFHDDPGNLYGNDLGNLYAALQEAESAGYIPVIALKPDVIYSQASQYPYGGQQADGIQGYNGYAWPSNASTPIWPTDADDLCAVADLEADLHNDGNGLLPSTTRIEAMNEPNVDVKGFSQNQLGKQCNSSAASGPDCAARYFADTEQATADENLISTANVIAGVFSSGNSTLTAYSSSCTAGGFESQYMCYLTHGDSAGSIPTGVGLSAYNQFAKSWSFHDYDDVDAASSCTPTSGVFYCNNSGVTNFDTLLRDWSEPDSDMWVTEAGSENAYKDTPTQQADEAEDWEQIKNYAGPNIPAHLFWYQYGTANGPSVNGGAGTLNGDTFDSALVDGVSSTSTGLGRESYCVLALGYSNRTTCTG